MARTVWRGMLRAEKRCILPVVRTRTTAPSSVAPTGSSSTPVSARPSSFLLQRSSISSSIRIFSAPQQQQMQSTPLYAVALRLSDSSKPVHTAHPRSSSAADGDDATTASVYDSSGSVGAYCRLRLLLHLTNTRAVAPREALNITATLLQDVGRHHPTEMTSALDRNLQATVMEIVHVAVDVLASATASATTTTTSTTTTLAAAEWDDIIHILQALAYRGCSQLDKELFSIVAVLLERGALALESLPHLLQTLIQSTQSSQYQERSGAYSDEVHRVDTSALLWRHAAWAVVLRFRQAHQHHFPALSPSETLQPLNELLNALRQSAAASRHQAAGHDNATPASSQRCFTSEFLYAALGNIVVQWDIAVEGSPSPTLLADRAALARNVLSGIFAACRLANQLTFVHTAWKQMHPRCAFQSNLLAYCHGTALVLTGHLVDKATEWSVSHHEHVKEMMNAAVTTYHTLAQQQQQQQHQSNTEARALPHTKSLARLLEGIRLGLKSFVKVGDFGTAVLLCSECPDIGPSWDKAVCFAEVNPPRYRDAIDAFGLFLRVVYGKYAVRGIPSYINHRMLATFAALGRQITAAHLAKGEYPVQHITATEILTDVEARATAILAGRDVPTAAANGATSQNHVDDKGHCVPGRDPQRAGTLPLFESPEDMVHLFESWVESSAFPGFCLATGLQALLQGALDSGSAASSTPHVALRASHWVLLVLLQLAQSNKRSSIGLTSATLALAASALHQCASIAATEVHRSRLEMQKTSCTTEGEGQGAKNAITAFAAALHQRFPRLGVWSTLVEWYIMKSDAPATSLHLVRVALASLSPDATWEILESLSHSITEELLLRSKSTSDGGGGVSQSDEAVTALMRAALETKFSRSPREPWSCVYCATVNSPSRTGCVVCGALRLHIWMCSSCGYFSSSANSRCVVCADERRSDATVIPLRQWTCKLCHLVNSATSPMFCASCRNPSYGAARAVAQSAARASATNQCSACGAAVTAKNIAAIMQPWCLECGECRKVAQHRASLWSCCECFSWNPWTLTHCASCAAAKPTLPSRVLTAPWLPWDCRHCGRTSNPPWRAHCSACCIRNDVDHEPHQRHPLHDNSPTAASDCKPVHVSVSVATMSAESAPPLLARCVSNCRTCGAALHDLLLRCPDCGQSAPLQSSSHQLRSALPPSPLAWVCLRNACLHTNPATSERCALCNELKGACTATAGGGTNLLAYRQPVGGGGGDALELLEPSEPEERSGQGPRQKSNDDEGQDVARSVPRALSLWPRETPLRCAQCDETIHPLNTSLLCAGCTMSAWSKHDVVAHLALWVDVKVATDVVHSCVAAAAVAPREAGGAETGCLTRMLTQRTPDATPASMPDRVLDAVMCALQGAPHDMLPWRGRDLANMQCAERSENPVHEPSGEPHSALQRAARLVQAVCEAAVSPHLGCSVRRRLLRLAVDLVDLVNQSTDFDELSFTTVAMLVVAIDHHDAPLPLTESLEAMAAQSARVDSLRLEYLTKLKVSAASLVGPHRCRDCLCVVSPTESTCDCRPDAARTAVPG